MTIEQEFFEAFNYKPKYIYHIKLDDDEGTIWEVDRSNCITNCKYCGAKVIKVEKSYPPITPEIVLGLEEIIFKSVFNDGIHIHSPFDEEDSSNWSYQLTYYKGGYYICGYGDTRTNALLDQFITIVKDEELEKEEKEFITSQVRALFNAM